MPTTRFGASWNAKLESQILEDSATATSLDIMWSSSQTGCGPLKRLLMDVEPMCQSTQATSSGSTGLSRGKTTSAPSALFPSHPSGSTIHPDTPRPMKRIRSGPHVFARQSSQSLDLLGKGKLATERLARMSHSLNEKAVSDYTVSQQKQIAHRQPGAVKGDSQPPLQSRSNLIHNRNQNLPARQPVNKQPFTRNRNPTATSGPENSPGVADAKPLTTLKDSPKKGRLKALLKTIDYEKVNATGLDHREGLPVRNAASSQARSERLSKDVSSGMGQSTRVVDHSTPKRQQLFSSSDSIEICRPLPPDSNFTAQNRKKLEAGSSNSPAPSHLQPKGTYRVGSQGGKVDSLSLSSYLPADGHHPEPTKTTIATEVDSLDDSFNDDSLYNEANSSSSYGDIDIDARLLEEVCQGYDT